MSIKSFNLRIQEDMLNKLAYVADYYGRSTTGQLVYMARKLVEEHEEKYGEIPTYKPSKPKD